MNPAALVAVAGAMAAIVVLRIATAKPSTTAKPTAKPATGKPSTSPIPVAPSPPLPQPPLPPGDRVVLPAPNLPQTWTRWTLPASPGILTPTRADIVRIVVREFRAAGLPDSVLAAALVNAWAESKFDPRIKSPGSEDSIGVFQLNSRGLGAGMSADERRDPTLNTRRIIQEIKRVPPLAQVTRANAGDLSANPAGRRLLAASAAGEPLARLIALFTEDIERPADRAAKGRERAAIGRSWWGSVIDQRGAFTLGGWT